MKKSVLCVFLAPLFAAAGALAGCGGALNGNEAIMHTVVYKDGETTLFKERVEHNFRAAGMEPAPKAGYEFEYWTNEGYRFSFDRVITSDLTLYAAWAPSVYDLVFVADGEVVKETTYSVGMTVIPPEVPPKFGYDGVWENFSPDGGNLRINAIYTPKNCRVKFCDGDAVIAESRAVYGEEIPADAYPQAPYREGYEAVWGAPVFDGEEYEIKLTYSPCVYTASFYADGVFVGERKFTAETEEISPPAVPEKEGYDGKWEDFELGARDVRINAVYSPRVYPVKFVDGDGTIYESEVRYGEEITPPEPPEIAGYITDWGEAEFADGVYTVRLIKTPVRYEATFIADGKTVAKVPFTIEDESIIPPAVPEKEGYTGSWEDFSPRAENFTVNAIYIHANPPESRAEPNASEGSEGLIFSETEGGLEVTGYEGGGEVVIPAYFGGKPVVGIGEGAFKKSDIVSIELPDGVKSIGKNAFKLCVNLREVKLGEGLTTIGYGAFSYCGSLSALRLPRSVTSVDGTAFSGCAATVYACRGLDLGACGDLNVVYYD